MEYIQKEQKEIYRNLFTVSLFKNLYLFSMLYNAYKEKENTPFK